MRSGINARLEASTTRAVASRRFPSKSWSGRAGGLRQRRRQNMFQGLPTTSPARRTWAEAALAKVRREVLREASRCPTASCSPRPMPKHAVVVLTDVNAVLPQVPQRRSPTTTSAGIAVEYMASRAPGIGSPTTRRWSVWCSADRKKALTDAKNDRAVPSATCKNPVDAEYARPAPGPEGTPMILTEAGTVLGGIPPPDERCWRQLDEPTPARPRSASGAMAASDPPAGRAAGTAGYNGGLFPRFPGHDRPRGPVRPCRRSAATACQARLRAHRPEFRIVGTWFPTGSCRMTGASRTRCAAASSRPARLRRTIAMRPSRFVVPRLAPSPPWASKATELLRWARPCRSGGRARHAYRRPRLAGRSAHPGRAGEGAARPDDAVAARRPRRGRGACSRCAGAALETVPVAARSGERAPFGLALAAGRDRLPARTLRRTAPRPARRRADDVRAGEPEHRRHKIFNASWTIDGASAAGPVAVQDDQEHARGARRAHAVGVQRQRRGGGRAIAARASDPIRPAANTAPRPKRGQRVLHQGRNPQPPTAIAPFPGVHRRRRRNPRRGRDRPRRQARRPAVRVSVSHLRIPTLPQPWERERALNPRMAPALEIMLDGPIGAAAFNNEFGRPNLTGYFRSFELQQPARPGARLRQADHARRRHRRDRPPAGRQARCRPGDAVIVLGGPAMLIGLGGGAASSVASGDSAEDLDFASGAARQPGNGTARAGSDRPLRRLRRRRQPDPVGPRRRRRRPVQRDPELLHDSGGRRRDRPRRCPATIPPSPMQLWCNESQERYVLASPHRASRNSPRSARASAARSRWSAPATAEERPGGRRFAATVARESALRPGGCPAIDLPMDVLFGKAPKMHRDAAASPPPRWAPLDGKTRSTCARPACACSRTRPSPSKSFLVTIGDRSVGGLTARDQMVGPWQLPVGRLRDHLSGFEGFAGEAMAIGERTPLALLDAAAAARMAVARRSPTRRRAGRRARRHQAVRELDGRRRPCRRGRALFDAVKAVGMELCPAARHLSIPVGKDSLSMQARGAGWRGNPAHRSVSPVSLIVTVRAGRRRARAAADAAAAREVEPSCG